MVIGAVGRHRVVERRRQRADHARRRQLGEEIVDRIVERQHAVGDEGQRRRRRDRLADRGDAEQRVRAHRRPADRLVAEHGHVEIAAAPDDGDESGHIAGADMGGEGGGEGGGGHGGSSWSMTEH